MPLSTEAIAQKPLGGREVIQLVLNDLREMMERDGLFSPYAAYRQVSWSISVRFNLNGPTHAVNVAPRTPLTELSEVDVTLERDREVISPNAARVLNDLPIVTQVHLGEGRIEERVVQYGKESVPPQPPPVDRVIDAKRPEEPESKVKRVVAKK